VKGIEAWGAFRHQTVRSGFADAASWNGHPFAEGGLAMGVPQPGLRNASLWLRTAAGWSPGEPSDPFANFYFGAFGNNWLDYQEPKRYRDPERFPGVPIDAVSGTNYLHGLVDWNLPALRFRRAGTLAFYASWARISLFAGGLASNISDPGSQRKLLDVRMQLLTQSPLMLSLGFARAVERGQPASQEWMASLKIL
jgi:hypothetical protein